jgi:uncharacterized protein YkwD
MKKYRPVCIDLSTIGLSVVLLILFFACAAKPAGSSKPAAPAAPKTEAANLAPGMEQSILDLINQHRAAKKLPPLQANDLMEVEARRHSMDMATKRMPFGHQGFNLRTKKIKERINGVTTVAENVAQGQMTARAVVDSWLSSPGHRQNIEGNFRLTGIGVARDRRSQLYFTQLFAR